MAGKRSLLFGITLAALILTVPWFFFEESDTRIFGFPNWAAYAVAASVIYAALIAFCVGRFWDLSGGEEERSGEGE